MRFPESGPFLVEGFPAKVVFFVGELADTLQVFDLGKFDVNFCQAFEGFPWNIRCKARNGPG